MLNILPIKNILGDKQKPLLDIPQSNPPSVTKNSPTKKPLTTPESIPQVNSLSKTNDLLENTPESIPQGNTHSQEEIIDEHSTPNISKNNLHSDVSVKNSDLASPPSKSHLSFEVSDDSKKSDNSLSGPYSLLLDSNITEGETNRDQHTNNELDEKSNLFESWELIDKSDVNATQLKLEDNKSGKSNAHDLQLENENKNVVKDENNSGEMKPLTPLSKITKSKEFLRDSAYSGKLQNHHNLRNQKNKRYSRASQMNSYYDHNLGQHPGYSHHNQSTRPILNKNSPSFRSFQKTINSSKADKESIQNNYGKSTTPLMGNTHYGSDDVRVNKNLGFNGPRNVFQPNSYVNRGGQHNSGYSAYNNRKALDTEKLPRRQNASYGNYRQVHDLNRFSGYQND